MKQSVAVAAHCLIFLAIAGAAAPTVPAIFARRDYTGLESYWLQVADTNGDGIVDLVQPGSMEGNDAYPSGIAVSSVKAGCLATNRQGRRDIKSARPGRYATARRQRDCGGRFQSGPQAGSGGHTPGIRHGKSG
jgi:hypothetical protein